MDRAVAVKGDARRIADRPVGHIPAAGQVDRRLAAGEYGVGRDLLGGDGLRLAVFVDVLHGNLPERRRDGDGGGGHGKGPLVRVVARPLLGRDGLGIAFAIDIGHGQSVQHVVVVRRDGQRDGVVLLGQRGGHNAAVRGLCDGDGIGAGGHELLARDLRDISRRQRAAIDVLRAVGVCVFQVLAA